MKKILNDPENVVEEYIEGMLYANPGLNRVGNLNCVIRANPVANKVGLVSLGGSGHEPAHAGFIGVDALDGVACGRVFASPSVEQIFETAKAVHTGAGILFIVKNYTGDKLNTESAMEMLEDDGIESKMLIVADDVAPVEGIEKADRRGVAGTILVHRILGTAARGYNDLDYLYDLGTKVCSQLKTAGLALSPCTIPYVGTPNFTIPDDKVTIGIGIHGEPGVMDKELCSCDELTNQLLDYIIADFEADGEPLIPGDSVVALVNGMGATPLMELYVVNRCVNKRLESMEVKVIKNPVGDYMTSLEMEGYSVTLLRLKLEYLPLINSLVR